MSQQESPQPLGSRQPHRQSRPSPLSQVQTTDILSSNRNSRAATPASFAASEVRSDVAQDPLFWKRFSQAVQVAEESKAAAAAAPAGGKKAENRASGYSGRGSWLQQQKREKRKCRVTCTLIIGAAIAVIIALVVVLVIVVKV